MSMKPDLSDAIGWADESMPSIQNFFRPGLLDYFRKMGIEVGRPEQFVIAFSLEKKLLRVIERAAGALKVRESIYFLPLRGPPVPCCFPGAPEPPVPVFYSIGLPRKGRAHGH